MKAQHPRALPRSLITLWCALESRCGTLSIPRTKVVHEQADARLTRQAHVRDLLVAQPVYHLGGHKLLEGVASTRLDLLQLAEQDGGGELEPDAIKADDAASKVFFG